MKGLRITIFSILLLACGCANENTSSLDTLLFDLKRNVIISNERTLLEEFVKYHEFGGNYFSLFSIDSLTLKTSISNSKMTEKGSVFDISKSSKLEFSNRSQTIIARGGNAELVLKPLTIANYENTKKIFDEFAGKIKYVIFYPKSNNFENLKNPESLDDSELKCFHTIYCVPVDGLTENGETAWAYLENSTENIKEFKKFEESFSDTLSIKVFEKSVTNNDRKSPKDNGTHSGTTNSSGGGCPPGPEYIISPDNTYGCAKR